MARRKRPLTFVPTVLFLSSGVVALAGSIFYSTTAEPNAPTMRSVVARLSRKLKAKTSSVALVSTRPSNKSPAAYLEITQTAADRYDVVWRTPVVGSQRLPIAVRFPSTIRSVTELGVLELTGSYTERRTIAVDGGLDGTRIRFDGLEASIADVVIRVQRQDGSHTTLVVHPSQPWFDMPRTLLLERSIQQLAQRWPLLGIMP